MNDSHIQKHVEVIGADGVHVGTVDRIENSGRRHHRSSSPMSPEQEVPSVKRAELRVLQYERVVVVQMNNQIVTALLAVGL